MIVGAKWDGKRLELNDDYYCYAYLAHIKKNRYEFSLKCDETAGFFKTSTLIFCVQMVLILLIGRSIISDFADKKVEWCSNEVLIPRFICTILLHN